MNEQAENNDIDNDQEASEESLDERDELEALQEKVDENWDKYLRAAAELDNVRKRAARDVENARKFAVESFGRDLLGVVDSFEMGLESSANADAETLREGSEATLKQLQATLDRVGICPVDPVGEPFDPEFHEAISMQPSADMEPGSVLAVVQKGYTIKDRLLRPARVVVSTEAPSESTGDTEQ